MNEALALSYVLRFIYLLSPHEG